MSTLASSASAENFQTESGLQAVTHFGDDLYRVKDFAEKHKQILTLGTLRDQIHKAKPRQGAEGIISGNGLTPAIIKVGKIIYIREPQYFEWLESQNAFGGASDE